MIPKHVMEQKKLYGTQKKWTILLDIIYFTPHVYTGTSLNDLNAFIKKHWAESERIRYDMMNDPF